MFKLRDVLSRLRGELATREANAIHGNLGASGYKFVTESLAQTKFGNLRQGEHLETGEKVAIWIIQKHNLTDDVACERLADEIAIKSRIDHPNCIYMYETLEDDSTFSFVEEYCTNGSLGEMLSRSASLMVEHKCSQLFWQVATAVEYLHALGIAHRRINVDCVLLDPDVNLKLMDFGCAINFLGKGHQLEKNHPIALKYLPPEAFNAEVKDQRHIDIWQLGLLLFKLLTKLDPFDRLEGTALTDKLAAGTVFMPKFISEEGRAFLGLMLNPNPDLRPTAEQVLQHPWMKRNCPSTYPLVQQSVDIDRQALKKMSTGFKVDRRFHSRMIESLISNEKNWLTAK